MKRIEKVKEFAKRHADKVALTGAMLLASAPSAFASGNGLAEVTTAIEGAAGGLKTEAPKIISAALGVGVIFWGAKKAWRHFKGI